MLFGVIFAIMHGATLPLSLLLYRNILNELIATDVAKEFAKATCIGICANATSFLNKTCNPTDLRTNWWDADCESAQLTVDACGTNYINDVATMYEISFT